jgi:lysophospholipase L1-like esterase
MAQSHHDIIPTLRHTRVSGASHFRTAGSVLCCLLLILGVLLSSCASPTSTPQKPASRPTTPATKQPVYVAIGASDTFGLGTVDPYNLNWASDLSRDLNNHYHLVNLGVPGMLLHQALSIELPVAQKSHPALVTVWLAVNDIVAGVDVTAYAHDLDTLLTSLQEGQPAAQIVIANVPDLTLLPHFYKSPGYDQQALEDQINAYNAVISAAVQKHHILLVDLSQQGYDLANHPEYISDDGLHPTALGYKRLAELFYQTITGKTLQEKNRGS